MVIGFGIDTVDIVRFGRFAHYAPHTLARLFTHAEIAHCLAIPAKSAERFAVRYAAKEACFKALSIAFCGQKLSFFRVARYIEIVRVNGSPQAKIAWGELGLPERLVTISLTHAREVASAAAIVQ